MTAMRVSQLAERSGIPATTLRFYESAGLLPADRSPAGYRLYGEDAVERLSFIGAAKHLGLPLEEISELLTVWESGTCAEVRADLRPRLAARIADAEVRAAELAAFTATLQRAQEHLDTLPERPGRCDPECGFRTAAVTAPPPIPAASSVPVTPAASCVPAAPSAPAEPAKAAGAERSAPTEPEAERWRNAPVACSLDGDGLGERTARWRRLVDGAERQRTAEGVRLTLPADRAGALAALAADEQRCCPFFDFHLHLDGPVLHLQVRAPAEGAALLTALFGPAT